MISAAFRQAVKNPGVVARSSMDDLAIVSGDTGLQVNLSTIRRLLTQLVANRHDVFTSLLEDLMCQREWNIAEFCDALATHAPDIPRQDINAVFKSLPINWFRSESILDEPFKVVSAVLDPLADNWCEQWPRAGVQEFQAGLSAWIRLWEAALRRYIGGRDGRRGHLAGG